MADDAFATAALDDLAQRRPEVVALARAASVAAIIEPALLRRLRLGVPGLAPRGAHLHAGTEADLWFSRLPHVATAGQLTLRPAIAETLRRQLAQPPYHDVAYAARRIVLHAHAQHPDMIRLEERVIWSAIMGDTDDVGSALDRALAAIRLGPERATEVVRWFMQARRRLPPSALTHPSGRRLLAAVAMHTDRVVPAELLTAERFPDAVGDLAPSGLPVTTVGVELVEGGIRFVPDGQPTAATVTLPDTRPLVLEARWQDQDEMAYSAVVVAQPGAAAALAGLSGPVVLRTLAGQRVRLRSEHAREVVIAMFGTTLRTEPELEPLSSLTEVSDVKVRFVHEQSDLYSTKPEVLIIGPGQPVAPGFGDFIAAFMRAAVRARASTRSDPPGVIIWLRDPGSAPDSVTWWHLASRNDLQVVEVNSRPFNIVSLIYSTVRAVTDYPGRMYELDVNAALAMLHVLALAFHVRRFYSQEAGRDGERQLFDLGDEHADIDYLTFQHVLGMCEWIFSGPVRDYLGGGEDPTQAEPTPPASYETVPRDVSGRRLQDPGWSPFPAPWDSFVEYLTWFFQQFHRYAEFMRDRLGPRRVVMGFAVPLEVVEICRLALGTAALPLGQDENRFIGDSGAGVVFPVERARLPGLISALAGPVLLAAETARAERTPSTTDRSYLIAAAGAPVTSVAFYPDGRLLVTAGAEPIVRIWDVFTRHWVLALQGHAGPVEAVAVAPDGTWLATGSRDDIVQIWDAATGTMRQTLTGLSGGVAALAIAPDSSWLATASRDGAVQIWDAGTWNPLTTVGGEFGEVPAFAVAPDGTWLAAGGNEGIRILDLATGVWRISGYRPSSGMSGLAVGPDGTWLAIGDNVGTVELWDVSESGEWEDDRLLVGTGPGSPNPVAAGHTRSGQNLLATTGYNNSVRIWNLVAMRLTSELLGHTAPVNALAFSPAASLLASASDDGTVRLWDVRTGEPAL